MWHVRSTGGSLRVRSRREDIAMGLIRFYGLVLREAFRHSLDIAQAVIFVILVLAGFIAARNPASKPMIDTLDLTGWKIAAIVFGGIIIIRLALAPYWLWRERAR